jgi:hypothetical protein
MTNYNPPPGNRDEDIQSERERAAENSGTANGLAIGGTLAALIGLGAAALYYWSRPTPAPTSNTTIVNPAASTAPQSPAPTRIIERTVEKAAPPKVVEIQKPVIVPGATKIVEVQKPVIVPGATKTVEVQKPTTAASPSTVPSTAPSVAPSPSASPTPSTSQSPTPSDAPASTAPSGGTNESN